MSPQQKQKLNSVRSAIHEWMSIFGFTVLGFLIVDMYTDFKEIKKIYVPATKEAIVKLEGRTTELEKTSEKHENLLMRVLFSDQKRKASFLQTTEEPQ